MKTALITGGAGYVGSHCCKAFARAGWKVVVFDNLSRGWRDAVRFGPLVEGDIRDAGAVSAALAAHKPDVVVHFAAFAYVGESVTDPAIYYDNNVFGTHVLLEQLRASACRSILLSSSCATYGVPDALPIDEASPQAPINPYGLSKLMVEQMTRDYVAAYGLSAGALRYFNAAGCDAEGELGERHDPETHLIPLALRAALSGEPLTVNGEDFDTRDGTAERDFIHVTDLAQAHLLAAERIVGTPGFHTYNLGTGTGTTILELLDAVRRITGRTVPVRMGPRRPGDPAALVASPRKAMGELGWTPRHSSIDNIVATAAAWEARAQVFA
ncbi:MAG: UDP-glucose 4-epimerase GalE [Caulobacterales bacterium 68-7]|nr:MAG: UDP-glucose 4-epimerase GalE [Caulobacterales bacterium 68-7]